MRIPNNQANGSGCKKKRKFNRSRFFSFLSGVLIYFSANECEPEQLRTLTSFHLRLLLSSLCDDWPYIESVEREECGNFTFVAKSLSTQMNAISTKHTR